jgi:hypothetical protein
MKLFKNLSITAVALLLTLPVISGHHEEGAKDPMKKNVMTAKKWVEAGYTSKDKAMKMVKKYMAEDGYNYGSRFIGFGFYYDPNSEDRLVDGVIEGSPAAKVCFSKRCSSYQRKLGQWQAYLWWCTRRQG